MHNESIDKSRRSIERSLKKEKAAAVARLTGNYNHDRKICSSHEHSEVKVPLPLFSKKVSI